MLQLLRDVCGIGVKGRKTEHTHLERCLVLRAEPLRSDREPFKRQSG